MKTSERVLRALCSSVLICRHSDAEGFEYLSDVDNADFVKETLSRFALRLTMTSRNSAFFAAEQEGSKEAEVALASDVRAWVHEYEQNKMFADLIASTEPGSFRLEPGQRIAADKIIAAAANNPAVVDLITAMNTNMGLKSKAHADAIIIILDKFSDRGFIKAINAKARVYIVTGQADRFWDIAEEFVNRIPEIREKVEELTTSQGELF